METYGYIYITTNKINDKRYIGQHKHKDWDYSYYGSGKYLKRAIKKYGIENFTCFPLMWAWNKDELNKLEIGYITHYKPEYNISTGGNGGNLGEEVIKKMSKSLKGKPTWNKGKKFSEEVKQKMSESHKGNKYCLGRVLSNETREKIRQVNLGKKHSEETKQKMSETRKGKTSPYRGRHHSEEIKQKISEAGKLRWKKYREK
jgi:group I intron endonuclease